MRELHDDYNEVIEIASSTTTFSGVYQIDPTMRLVDIEAEVQAVVGAAPTIDITPQVSSDKVTWVDDIALAQKTGTGTEKARLIKAKTYLRFKIVTAGTFTSARVRVFAQAIPGDDSGAVDGETYSTSILSIMGAVVADVTSMAAVTIGKATKLFTDVAGRLIVTLGTLIAGEDLTNDVIKVEMQGTAFAIQTATTTLVDSGVGFVHEIFVVGGTLGNVTIYDSLVGSGTELLPTVTAVNGGVLLKNVKYSTGLTIVTAAATVIVGSIR